LEGNLFLGALTKRFRKETAYSCLSFLPSVRPSFRLPAWENEAPTGQIFVKINGGFVKIYQAMLVLVKIAQRNLHKDL
jgi:hypothetical protein